MAVDHALLERGVPALRFYRWQPHCLSFGRNQPALGLYDTSVARSLGIDIVRRPTGGAAVLHGVELTYCFVAPALFLGGPRESYLAINRALVRAVRRLGGQAMVSSGVKRAPFGTVHPCFAEPAAGEVVVNGMKLVGSAQRVENRVLLQHGSLLLDGTQDAVAQIASVPFSLQGRATTLREVLGELPSYDAIVDALAQGFEEECGIALADSQSITDERVAQLEVSYKSDEWTWRR
jgi:lipoate-protein ligase A